ncbi:MAG: hypothetical protein R3178_08390 [Rhodothermales bacterium]|nr:hypothetical protein [Rhodothermales bacterium]
MHLIPRNTRAVIGAVLVAAVGLVGPAAHGQITDAPVATRSYRAPAKAAALSLVLPGLGQRYANGGRWSTSATLFATADVAVWLGLVGTLRARSSRTDAYRTLAVSGANADIEGKDRRFFLNLATFRSSDEYLEVQLRNRAWDQLDYVSDPSYQWSWTDEADFLAFRDLRDDAESLGRRRSVLVAALVANRVISALVAVRTAGRYNRNSAVGLSFGPPPEGADWPALRMEIGF